jgi:hypothetical protein
VIAVVAVIGLGVVYPAVAVVLSRKDYGTFAFWKVPNRIDDCGRRYDESGPQQGTLRCSSPNQARRAENGASYLGRSIYADAAPPSPPRYTVCTMVMYIPLGDGRWETYSLSSGP